MRERESWWDKETEAATRMQSAFRGRLQYHGYENRRFMASQIQRVARGHCGRKRSRERRIERTLAHEKMVFDFYAEQIQKNWRGFYSRRHKHDFWARKMYIETVVKTGNDLREKLNAYAKDRAAFVEREREKRRLKEFKRVTENLHHLVGTKTTPGIYCNPYFEEKRPTVKGVSIEEHIKRAWKESAPRRTKTLRKKRAAERTMRKTRDADGCPQSDMDRRSIRISTTYDEVCQARKWERRLEKLKRITPEGFIVTGRREPLPKVVPIQTGELYIDPHLRFQSTKQLQERNKTARVSNKPFYTAVSSKKPYGMTV